MAWVLFYNLFDISLTTCLPIFFSIYLWFKTLSYEYKQSLYN
jgi:hypothetical protein